MQKLSALDRKAEFYAHKAEHARISMSMEERNEMRLRSPITMGELAWIDSVVSQVPALYRQDLSCTAHDRVSDVVRLIVERVLQRSAKEVCEACNGAGEGVYRGARGTYPGPCPVCGGGS